MPEMQPDSGTRSRTALKTIPLFQTNSETVPTLLSPLSPAPTPAGCPAPVIFTNDIPIPQRNQGQKKENFLKCL